MTHVKVCGFQRAEDALAAAEAGADAIGLIFVPSARRVVSIEQAEALLSEFRSHWGGGPRPQVVGLFADQPVEEVNQAVERLGLDAVQLCGSEGMAYCGQVAVPIYKVIAVDPALPRSVVLPKLMIMLQRHTMAGHRPVLDTLVPGAYGGTGQSFSRQLAADLAEAFKVGLAGGLTPENVAEVVKTVRPWGVDTSSGVETDGQKDPQRIRAFVDAVREADRSGQRRGLMGLLRRGRR